MTEVVSPQPAGRPTVVVAGPLPASEMERLRARAEVIIVGSGPGGADMATVTDVDEVIGRVEGILVMGGMRLDANRLRRAERLQVISTAGVGLNHIDLDHAAEQGITVTTTPVLSDAVADLVMALTLMLARRLPEAVRAARSSEWATAPLGVDLAGKALLIVGFGRIGREVARRALAFKMQVSYFDRRSGLAPMEGVERTADLREALGEADFVSLHVDLNDESRHLIGEEEIEAMKPTAFLVNTSRGAVVDQLALAAALARGRIAGAGLDVLEDEPPSPDEPLLGEARAIVLPHIGWATTETRSAMATLAVDNLLSCLAGEPCRDGVVAVQGAPSPAAE